MTAKSLLGRFAFMVGPIAVARLLSLALGAVQLPILTRQLPPDEYALVAAAIAIATYVSLVAGDPTTLGFQRFPGSFRERANFAYSRARLAIALAAVVCVGAVVALVPGQPEPVVGVVGWACGLAGMRFTSTAWLMWQQPWKYTANLGISTLLRTATLLVAIELGAPALVSLGIAGFVSFAVAVVLGPKSSWRRKTLRREAPWPRGTGVTLAIGSFGTTALLTIDKIVVPALTDGHIAGNYAAMNQVVTVTLAALLTVLSTAVAPRALALWNQGKRARALTMNALTVHVSTGIAGLWGLVILFGGFHIIALALGPGYTDVVLATGMCAVAGTYAVGQQASWSQRYQMRFRHVRNASLIGALVVLVGLPPATFFLGAVGAMMAAGIGTTTYAIVMLWKSELGSLISASTIILGTTPIIALSPYSSVLAVPLVLVVCIATFASRGAGRDLIKDERERGGSV